MNARNPEAYEGKKGHCQESSKRAGKIWLPQKRITTGRGKEWTFGGMEISLFYDPSFNQDFTSNLENKGSSPITEIPSSGTPLTGTQSTDKYLYKKYLHNSFLPNPKTASKPEIENYKKEKGFLADVDDFLLIGSQEVGME